MRYSVSQRATSFQTIPLKNSLPSAGACLKACVPVVVYFKLGLIGFCTSNLVKLRFHESWRNRLLDLSTYHCHRPLLYYTGALFIFDHPRLSILITMLYSILSVKGHGGWTGLIMCTIAAFISSDVVVYFLSGSEGNQESGYNERQSGQRSEQAYAKYNFSSKPRHTAGSDGPDANSSQGAHPGFTSASFSQGGSGTEDVRGSGGASTSGTSEGGDPTSAEEEVARVLGCSDHYAVLGFVRYDNFDLSVLKREYRKLVSLDSQYVCRLGIELNCVLLLSFYRLREQVC
jgi:hypothetical protein